MGINKTLEVVDTRFGAKLIIKTKDEQLPTAQRAKLLDAIKVAVDMLSVAGTKLTKWPWPELERSVLETHFRIGERRFRRRWAVPGQEQLAPGGPGREADLGGILEHGSAVRESRVAFQAITVMENSKKLRDVLKGNLKIADSYSSTFQFELQKAKTQNEAVLGYLKGEAEADFDGKGDYAAWAETQKAREAEYNKFLSDRDEREKSQATRLTEAENGYVKPHKPSLHKRPKEAKLEAPRCCRRNTVRSISISRCCWSARTA